MSDHNSSEDGKNKEYLQALNALKSIDLEPSPFMKTRVLSKALAMKKEKKKRFHWLSLFSGSFVTACLVLFVGFQWMNPSALETMEVGKPYIVKADLRSLESYQVDYIEIELDGAVAFSSQRHSQINEMRSLSLSWEKLVGKQYLPIVVQGTEKGDSKVRVHFYDKDNKLIKTQDFNFKFSRS